MASRSQTDNGPVIVGLINHPNKSLWTVIRTIKGMAFQQRSEGEGRVN